MRSVRKLFCYYVLASTLMHDQAYACVGARRGRRRHGARHRSRRFLVLEEKQHALNRGAKPFARLTSIESDHVKRTPGAIKAALERMWSRRRGAR